MLVNMISIIIGSPNLLLISYWWWSSIATGHESTYTCQKAVHRAKFGLNHRIFLRKILQLTVSPFIRTDPTPVEATVWTALGWPYAFHICIYLNASTIRDFPVPPTRPIYIGSNTHRKYFRIDFVKESSKTLSAMENATFFVQLKNSDTELVVKLINSFLSWYSDQWSFLSEHFL